MLGNLNTPYKTQSFKDLPKKSIDLTTNDFSN